MNRPIIGVVLLNQGYVNQPGAMISRVNEGSPAQQAGLKGLSRNRDGRRMPGDLIKAIDGKEIRSNIGLIETLESYKPGDIITVSFERKGELTDVTLKLDSSVK